MRAACACHDGPVPLLAGTFRLTVTHPTANSSRMSVNKVILIGHLGQNPEVKYTPSGAAVANFSVATNESWQDKSGQRQEKTEWHRVVVWGKTAENCGQYLSKGRQVYLEGRLQTRQWQDKDGQTKYTTEVQAQTVQFLGGAGAGAGASQGDRSSMDRPMRDQSSSYGNGMPQMGMQSSNNGGHNNNSFNSGSLHPMNNESSFTEDDIPF